jgi:hypothetical protein
VSSPVTLTQPADQTNSEGDTVSLALSATGSGTLSYSAVGLPAGLKINSSTGAITGTVALDTAANGPYSVTVVVGNGTSSASQTFTWTVNSPITLTLPVGQTNTEGDSVSLALSASGGGTLQYSAVGLPTGLKINPSTGVITGTVAAGASTTGPYKVTVTVGDGTYNTNQSFIWDVNNPISFTNTGEQFVSVGGSVSLQIAASSGLSGSQLFTAFGLPDGLSIDQVTGAITGTISSSAANAGPLISSIVVTIGGYSNTHSVVWSVLTQLMGLNHGPTLFATERHLEVSPLKHELPGGTVTFEGSDVTDQLQMGYKLTNPGPGQDYPRAAVIPGPLSNNTTITLKVKKFNAKDKSLILDEPGAPTVFITPTDFRIADGLQTRAGFQVTGKKPNEKDDGYYWVQYVNNTDTQVVRGAERPSVQDGWHQDGGSFDNPLMPGAYMNQEYIGSHPALDAPTYANQTAITSIVDKGDKVQFTLATAPVDILPNWQKAESAEFGADSGHIYGWEFQTYLMKTDKKDPIGYISWGFTVTTMDTMYGVSFVEIPRWHDGKDADVWGKIREI